MKTSSIVIGVLIVVLVGGAFYLMSRNRGSQSAAVTDSVYRSSTTASPGAFGNLVDKPTPAFSLKDRGGVIYSSDSLKGKNVVLFFNEGIMCYPACWNQMVALATDQRFAGSDIVALSIVTDQPSDWRSAIQKMPDLGKATVLFDTDKSVSQSFGMLAARSSMHYGSLPGHSFVIIDKQGIIRSVFDDPNMTIDNDKVAAELAKFN